MSIVGLPNETYLPADEAARELLISRRTLNKWAQSGRIAIIRHGRQAFVSRSAIRDYWSRRENAADQRRAAAEKRSKRSA